MESIPGYDDWKTTPPDDKTERGHLVMPGVFFVA